MVCKPSFFISSSMKDFLDKFFDLWREYQQEIPSQKIAEILKDYADRLDGKGSQGLCNFLHKLSPNFLNF